MFTKTDGSVNVNFWRVSAELCKHHGERPLCENVIWRSISLVIIMLSCAVGNLHTNGLVAYREKKKIRKKRKKGKFVHSKLRRDSIWIKLINRGGSRQVQKWLSASHNSCLMKETEGISWCDPGTISDIVMFNLPYSFYLRWIIGRHESQNMLGATLYCC